ncbi:MAG TPA: carbohydrate kinase, partial [Bacteroidota bacterium]|nr:carbohydrate kinase [Bacteroidota bacterium]
DANLFRSPIFCQTLANCTGVAIELYETDGAQGSARGAALGAGYYKSTAEIARGLLRKKVIEPDKNLQNQCRGLYTNWKAALDRTLAERS